MHLNIFSSSIIDTSRASALITFDGLLTGNEQIQLENILVNHQACSSSKIYLNIKRINLNILSNYLALKKSTSNHLPQSKKFLFCKIQSFFVFV